MAEEKKTGIVLKCVKCGEVLMKPSQQIEQFIGLVCGNDKCERFGLLSVVGKSEKKEESPIITPQ